MTTATSLDKQNTLFDQILNVDSAMGSYITENLPNPSKTIQSLRFLGYNSYSAITDIIDNSLDADATKVSVNIGHRDGKTVITIVDNGSGMDLETLDEALKLGSNTARNTSTDLGKYGMGLVTASLSLCRRVEVITKQKNGPVLFSVQDVDVIEVQDKFVKVLEEADSTIRSIFEESLGVGESGTVVILKHCDQLSNSNLTVFANILTKRIAQTFRYFITGGKEIEVNGKRIDVFDPLMLAEGAEIQSDEEYEIKYLDRDGIEQSSTMQVRIALLPDWGIEGNKQRGVNILNQGIFLLRNYREIASGVTFGLFVKHGEYNRIRAEVFVTGELDELIGVDFTKQNPDLKQAIADKLREVLLPQFNSLRKRIRSGAARSEATDVPHEESAKQIERKSHLLAKPKLEIEKRGPKETKGTPHSGDGTKKDRKNFSKNQKKPVSLPARFETVSMTAAGPIWDSDTEGRTIVIKWNVDHPFYQRFLLENKENQSMVNATDFLVYSLSAAELLYVQDDDEELSENKRYMMENIRATVSNNMRLLLS